MTCLQDQTEFLPNEVWHFFELIIHVLNSTCISYERCSGKRALSILVKSELCQKHSMVLFCNCVKTMSCIFFPLGLASFLRYNVCKKIFIEARLKFCSVLEPECISCTSNTKDMQALYAILVVCQIFFIIFFLLWKKLPLSQHFGSFHEWTGNWCMYFRPIRLKLLWAANSIAACNDTCSVNVNASFIYMYW